MKLTETRPTMPGIYLCQHPATKRPLPIVLETMEDVRFYQAIEGPAYLWSSRLVPVDEVEKAYREGWSNARVSGYRFSNEPYQKSRAKRVVDGTEKLAFPEEGRHESLAPATVAIQPEVATPIATPTPEVMEKIASDFVKSNGWREMPMAMPSGRNKWLYQSPTTGHFHSLSFALGMVLERHGIQAS